MLARPQPPSSVDAPSPGSNAGGVAAAPTRSSTPAGRDTFPETLTWTANVARRQPLRVAFALFAVAVTWWVALAAFHSPLMAVVGCMALLGALAEGLFPIHYRVTPAGVRARCAWQVRAIGWERVRTVWTGPDGVYLCPFARPSRLLRTRGVVLRYGAGNDSAVLEAVRRYWKQGNAPSDGAKAAA